MRPIVLPTMPTMESTAVGAAAIAADLRAVLVSVKDVQAWAESRSADRFTGDASVGADHALTRFARRLDVSEAALERAVVATHRFEDRLLRLTTRLATLTGEHDAIEAAATALNGDLVSATPAQLPGLTDRGEDLAVRADRLSVDVIDWTNRHDEAETDYVAALAAVDSVTEGEAAAQDPGRVDANAVVRGMPPSSDPSAVNRWWRGLSEAERQAVIAEHPQRVGNQGGIPVGDRDEANRAAVAADIDELTSRRDDGEPLTQPERDRLANATAVADALDGHLGAVDPVTGTSIVHLTQYQPDEHSGDGGVAIFVGDPDHADHVAVYVPGTLSESTNLGSTLDNVKDLYDHACQSGEGTVAIGFWLDYDAPSIDDLSPSEVGDLGSVVSPAEAEQGGVDLAAHLDGLQGSDTGPPAHVTLIGHSYGATTAAHAAAAGAPIDDLVLLGSPGAPAASAAGLTDADVHVGSADHDPITLLGGTPSGQPGPLGYDPAQLGFDGDRFHVDPGSYQLQHLLDNHSSYFTDESLDNVSTVVTGGDPEEVPDRGEPGGGYQSLDGLLLGSSGVGAAGWLWGTVEDVSEGLVGLPHVFVPGAEGR